MRRVVEEEEEEFVMATKRLKSNKSASALRAVSRLKNKCFILFRVCKQREEI
jgi:hypothetical protein